MIPLSPVTGSSQIDAVGYDQAAGVLAIRFHRGATYHYQNVPAEIHEGLLSAESKGKYFGAHIKGNPAYPFSKQPAETAAAAVADDVQ